jgi:glycosyltransferase involved in cell wall biosynthesis
MKVFFIGDTRRPDAQTWIRGVKLYGNCEVQTWELYYGDGAWGRIRRILDWFYACLFLKYKIKKFDADILLAYRVTSYGFLGACTGIHPFVVSQHGITDVWPQNSWVTPFKAFIGRYALKKADLIHAWGQVMVPAMLELKADPNKIRVLAKGVDTEWFNFTESDKDWSFINAVVTRTLSPDYRHEVILKAARILKDQNIPIKIHVIGDGPLMEELKLLASELDINDVVIWEGRIPNSELPKFLRNSNMYISTPISEGVSASLFEAMASGSFPVCTDLPGVRAWVENGRTGYLVPVDDHEALANAIIDAWNNKELMKQALCTNKAIIDEHATFQKNMPQIVDMYRELISRKKAKA